jgi:hypothetical protein
MDGLEALQQPSGRIAAVRDNAPAEKCSPCRNGRLLALCVSVRVPRVDAKVEPHPKELQKSQARVRSSEALSQDGFGFAGVRSRQEREEAERARPALNEEKREESLK